MPGLYALWATPMQWDAGRPDIHCTERLIYIGMTANLAERHVNHHRHDDAQFLDPLYKIRFCPVDISGSKQKIENALKPEETYLIAKHNPLLNNRTKFRDICTEAFQRYKWRIGILHDYRRDDSWDVELDQKWLDMCDLDLEPETDPYET